MTFCLQFIPVFLTSFYNNQFYESFNMDSSLFTMLVKNQQHFADWCSASFLKSSNQLQFRACSYFILCYFVYIIGFEFLLVVFYYVKYCTVALAEPGYLHIFPYWSFVVSFDSKNLKVDLISHMYLWKIVALAFVSTSDCAILSFVVQNCSCSII